MHGPYSLINGDKDGVWNQFVPSDTQHFVANQMSQVHIVAGTPVTAFSCVYDVRASP
jgi:hypothetical protein